MRSLGTRRAALLLGAATVAAIALAGCGAGQVSQTATITPATDGVNIDNADRSVSIRNLVVAYNSPKGYPAGGDAPLEMSLFNETTRPVTIRITSEPLTGADAKAEIVSARSVNLVGGTPEPATSQVPAGAEPSGSRSVAQPLPSESVSAGGEAHETNSPTPRTSSPSGAAGEPDAPSTGKPDADQAGSVKPAEFSIPPLASVTFRADDKVTLQAVGLSGRLVPGGSVNLIFTFSNGAAPLTVQAPVAMPLSPAPRGSAEHGGPAEHGAPAEHGGISEE